MVSAFTDYRYDFGPIERAIDSLGKGLERRRRLDQLGQVGQSLAGDNPDYGAAASKLMALGELGGATNLLTLKEASSKRGLADAATRSLTDALGGGGGSPFSNLGQNVAPATSTETSAPKPSLISSESGGRWDAQNNAVGAGGARGHFGRLQFGQARLQEAAAAGAIPPGTTPQAFMASPELQQRTEQWHFGDIDNFIQQNGYDRAVGQPIAGVPVTIEGMRAVAHLGGKEGLKRFLETGGQYNPADENGTRLSDYFRQHAGSGARMADAPAPGARPASMETGGQGFAVPDAPQMAGRTFDAITNGEPPLQPAFQAEGASQPWMGTALDRQRQARPAEAQMPPSRPYDVGADLPARGAVAAIGRLPPKPGPQPGQLPDLTSRDDGGSRQFAMAQGRNANPVAEIVPVADGPAALASAAPPRAVATGTVPARADLPAPGAVPTQGSAPVPMLSADLPRPTSPETARDYGMTRQMEAAKGQVGKLAAALANPNLPANARAVGEIFLKEAIEQSKAPESVKEYVYAKAMGWTTAKSPAEYAKEKTKTSPVEETEGRKGAAAAAGLKPGDAGYQGFILTGKMPREDAGPLSATDKKAILEADEGVMAAQTAIQALHDAKKLSPQALSGFGAGARATAANNLPDWMVPDGIASKQAGSATAELENVVTSQALAQLKSIFGAAPTEGERKILLDIQGSIGQPDTVRQKIYDRGIALAERRLAFNQQRANEMRGGEFYKSPEKRTQGTPTTTTQPNAPQQGQQRQPDASQAKRAPDGNYYVADPSRPGKYLMVQP